MRFVMFSADADEAPRLGALTDDGVVDLSGGDGPTDVLALIEVGPAALEAAADRLGAASAPSAVPAERVHLHPPLRPRNNVIAVGRNYVEHSREFSASGFDVAGKQTVPDHPVVFTKAASSIIGPHDAIDRRFDDTGTCDYEGELGVVIGPGGFRIPRAEAMAHVFGYTVLNDVTIREVQRRHVQFFLGKSAPTGCPLGPAVVTADEVPDHRSLRVQTRVNGELRQDAPVSDLIFPVDEIIATVSSALRLEPGDVIATGTPAGVGIGFDPPRFLLAGDEVEVRIDGVGCLRNLVL